MASLLFHSPSLAIFLLVLVQSRPSSPALILSLKNHHKNDQFHHRRPAYQSNQTSCALFSGTWVHDNSYPIYQSANCPNIIDPRFNCQFYGRPDSDYLRFRWQPFNCDLPRFNGLEFLLRMKGKTLMFVGDSLGRNQWESLICMVSATAPSTQIQFNRAEPLATFKFLEYDVTLSYYKAPYLVDIDLVQGKRTLKLEDISGNGNAWRNADVLLFNTGHWWSHQGALQGWDVIESGGSYYQDMDRLVALEKGLKTWAFWIENNIDRSRTKVFFQSVSPTHNSPGEYSDGMPTKTTTTNCYGEKEPTSGGAAYPDSETLDQTRIVEEVIKEMHYPAIFMDITALSALRKDCHPSIYTGDLTPSQKANPRHSSDCSHWCLPGLPDTWNQLLYTVLFY